MKIHVMRHGKSEGNEKDAVQQTTDEGLSKEGERQVIEALRELPTGITKIISSPMRRAWQTAEIVAQHLQLQIMKLDGMRERSVGDRFPFKTWKEAATFYGHEERSKYDFTSYGGDSNKDVDLRILNALREIKEQFPQEKVLVISHGGILRRMHRIFSKDEVEEKKFKNASIHEFDIGNVEAIILGLNQNP